MTLFLVGVVEMAVAASWTRYIARQNVMMNGVITYVNIFIWYYVIDQVINHIEGWYAIIPYAAGCAIGSMLGASDPKVLLKGVKKILRRYGLMKKKTVVTRLRVPAEL